MWIVRLPDVVGSRTLGGMPPYRSSDDRDAIRKAALEAAEGHGGVFTRADLARLGIDPEIVPSMVSKGLWRRLRHGVYVDTAAWDASSGEPRERHLLECAAMLRALNEPAYLFGTSAAVAHDLPLPGHSPGPVTLLRAPRMDGRILGGRAPRSNKESEATIKSHALTEADTTVQRGFPCVTRELAAVSAATAATTEWAVAILDAAAWQRPEVPHQLDAIQRCWPYLRGIGTVRAAVPHVRSGAQTPLESISRYRLVMRGLPEPELQVRFEDRDGLIGYVDMWWPTLGVIGEADGLIKYTDRADLIAEKQREDRLRRLGFVVVRWTWREIMQSPATVAQRIWEAAAASAKRAV